MSSVNAHIHLLESRVALECQDRFEAAQSADGRYRMLVEAVTDYAIYMLDPDGIVSSWNPGARRFKGYEESEIIGEHFSRFYTDEDRATGLPQGRLRQRNAKASSRAKAGASARTAAASGPMSSSIPSATASGKLLGYAKVTRDLTERRAAEAELRKSQEQFQLLVQGVTDYAIYLLDPAGQRHRAGIRARSGSRATSRKRSSASTFRPSTRRRSRGRTAGNRA